VVLLPRKPTAQWMGNAMKQFGISRDALPGGQTHTRSLLSECYRQETVVQKGEDLFSF
jgi:hypothetical protein